MFVVQVPLDQPARSLDMLARIINGAPFNELPPHMTKEAQMMDRDDDEEFDFGPQEPVNMPVPAVAPVAPAAPAAPRPAVVEPVVRRSIINPPRVALE